MSYYDKASGEWKDGDGLFLTVNAWRQQAENVAESVAEGTMVVVTGRLRQRTYETQQGEKRTVFEVEADDVAVSLKFATAKVSRAERRSQGSGQVSSGQRGAGGGSRGSDPDPWASDSGSYGDEPPFLSAGPPRAAQSRRISGGVAACRETGARIMPDNAF